MQCSVAAFSVSLDDAVATATGLTGWGGTTGSFSFPVLLLRLASGSKELMGDSVDVERADRIDREHCGRTGDLFTGPLLVAAVGLAVEALVIRLRRSFRRRIKGVWECHRV
jgi:hypothetical protein